MRKGYRVKFMAQSCLKKNGREYIRHPADVPILVKVIGNPQQMRLPLNNISQGGLAFESPTPFDIGSPIEIKIKAERRVFRACGVVQWCVQHEHAQTHGDRRFTEEGEL